jgi:hypothetical protein
MILTGGMEGRPVWDIAASVVAKLHDALRCVAITAVGLR